MKRILMTATAMVVGAGAAMAGNTAAPVIEPVVQPVASIIDNTNANWDGFYAGAQLGYGKPDGAVEDNGVMGGIHGGYMKDYGSYVLGGELAYNATNMEEKGVGEVKNIVDAKAIVGVPSGKWLTYGALGASWIDAKVDGQTASEIVPMIGVGTKYQVNEKWSVGAELDYRKGDNFDDKGADLDLTSLSATASFRF